MDFVRDGGLEILHERFQQYQAVSTVGEVACRSIASLAQSTAASRRMAELGTIKTLIDVINTHTDSAALQGEACRAMVNLSQDDVAKTKINALGGFQLMLQSQKRFEFEPEFWEMRWGMKEMELNDNVMVNYHGKGRWCSARVTAVNKGNGTYDVTYAHGGMDRRVPAQWVRPKDKSDQIEEFVAVWQWKPNGKLTEDELTLKSDGMLSLKSQGLGAAGTWNVSESKGTGRNVVKLNLSGEVSSIDMERISMTALRATNSSHRAVVKDENEDCLYASYFGFKEGVLGSKRACLLGRKPDLVRSEQQIQWPECRTPWTGLPENFAVNYATRWKGLLEISKMGEYTFYLEADTGAVLWLNEKVMAEAPGEGKLQLIAGQHRLRLDYFCKAQASKMVSLSYCGPDTGNEKSVVPVAALQHNKDECQVFPKPGFIAEYFPEEYESGEIPEGIEPDVVRTEKQLDFDEVTNAWQGLPSRYAGSFAARFSAYINLTCGDARKASYTFTLESGKKGRLYVDDTLLVREDNPAEIELKKGPHLLRVECFCKTGDPHGLKLFYAGPETGVKPQEEETEPVAPPVDPDNEEDPSSPTEGIKPKEKKIVYESIIVPPTVTCYYNSPSCAQCKGEPLLRHEKSLSMVFWSSCDMRVASVGNGGKMMLWDPPSGSWIGELSVGGNVTCGCQKSATAAIALDDAEHSIKVFDFVKESAFKTLVHERKEIEYDGAEEEEEPTAQPAFTPGGHEGRINAVAFNHDESLLASCSEDGILKFWDVASGAEKATIPIRTAKTDEPIPILALAFSGDGSRLLSGGKEKCMRIWVPSRGDTLRGPDKKIVVHEPEDGWPDGTEPEDEFEPGDPIVLPGHDAHVVSLALCPKDEFRFASASTDATIRIWDLKGDEYSAALEQVIDPIQCLTSFVIWSPDAATLVSSAEDIYVQLWSAVTGKPRAEPLKGHMATVRAAAWAPNAQCFVTGSEDNAVRMWHFLINRNITEIAELEGEQMVFGSDMRAWGALLAHIRKDFTNYKHGLSHYEPDIVSLRKSLDEGVARTQSYTRREQLLGLEVTDYFELDGMIDDFAPYYNLWHMVIEFQRSEISWTNDAISTLDSSKIESQLESWYKDVYKMIKAFDNNNMRSIQKIAKDLRTAIDDFKLRFPFLRCFANESILPRHWDEMFNRMKIDKVADYDKITLKMMLHANVADFPDDFEELSTAAAKEHGLKKALAAMKRDWEPLEFQSNLRNGVPLLKGIDDIQGVLDDHITKTQAIRSSPFCKPFEQEVHTWEATLVYIQDFIDQTIALQRSWMALEPIFVSDDIKRQLPHESESFSKIDGTFRSRMNEVDSTKNCIKISQIENIVEDMTECNVTIEKVQKGLKDYLETKRLFFPRFFFLNDADLLSILAETKDPTLVQPHMGKAFEGIAKVRFDDTNSRIEAMISAEGEIVDFQGVVDVNKPGNKGAVERWLVEVEETMMDSLRTITKASNDAYATSDRPKWCCEWGGQIVICTDCIYWSAEVTESLKRGAIAEYEKKTFCAAERDR